MQYSIVEVDLMTTSAYQPIKVSHKMLLFDPNNYRFQSGPNFAFADERRFHDQTVQARAFARLRDDGVDALKESILANGFIPVESLVVRPYSLVEDLYLVLEGNRRLAAVRWIVQDYEAGVDVSVELLKSFEEIPVVVVRDTEDPAFYEALMGVRHVAGIKQWGGYQSAKLITRLRDEYLLSAGDVANRIGLTVQETNRRYRAFKALEQMRQNEDYGSYVNAGFYPLFLEAIGVAEVKNWLGWEDSEGSFTHDEELEKFYSLITPTEVDDEVHRPPKITTREAVRELKNILPNEEARRILLDPNESFLHASTVGRRKELSHSWVSKVADTISALESVGAIELVGLSEADLGQIAKLAGVATNLLDLHKNYTRNS